MIHKADAFAALDKYLRDGPQLDLYQEMDKHGRLVLREIFDGKESISRDDASRAIMILNIALAGLMAARSTSIDAGDDLSAE